MHPLPVLPGSAALVLLAAAGLTGLFLPQLRLAGVAVLFFCLTAATAAGRLAERWPAAHTPADVAVRGWIESFPTNADGRSVFVLRTAGHDGQQAASAAAAGTAPTAPGQSRVPVVPRRLRLTWYDPPAGLEPGASLDLIARIRAPRGLVNPGGFDYERWLLTEDIGATGYVREGRLDSARRYGVAQGWLEFRARLAGEVRSRVGDATAGALIVALALGVRSDFDEAHWRTLRRTGTSHLVAISGLHVGLVAAFAFQVLLRGALRLPYRLARHAWAIAGLVTMVPATTYAALAGFSLPTVRALLMLAVVQLVLLSRRRVAPATGLALALLIVIGLEPLATLGASFWLSFGAVALIMLAIASGPARSAAATVVDSRGAAVGARTLVTIVRVQWTLAIGLMPLSAAFFGEVSIVAPVVNLIAVPVFSCLLVPASLALALLSLLGIEAAWLSAAAAYLSGATWSSLAAMSEWDLASVEIGAPGMLAAAAGVAGCVLYLTGPARTRCLALCALLPLIWRSSLTLADGEAEVTILDVGHGLAVLVGTRSHSLLYDTGPLSRAGFDAGREIVAPFLRHRTGGKPDVVVVSHGDSDHAGGLAAISELVPGFRLLHGPDMSEAGGEVCQAGQGWIWDQVSFTFVHPPADFLPRGNESSCVLRVDAAGGSVLLTGDIEARGEAALAGIGLESVSVVVVPHHGSATSSTAAFVRAADPLYAIVSAGFANRWSFPRPDVQSRWRSQGATLITTGDVGAVTVAISDSGVRVRKARSMERRYWRAPESSGASTGSAL